MKKQKNTKKCQNTFNDVEDFKPLDEWQITAIKLFAFLFILMVAGAYLYRWING